MRAQTWDLLVQALDTIDYTRDRPPKRRWDDQKQGCETLHTSDRFLLLADEPGNYAILYIYTLNPNTYRPEELRHTRHEFVVPVATYHQGAWTRWVFDRIASIEHHETCESFQVNGERIYAPHHGNGEDPYTFWPGGTAEQKAKAPGDD